jgi:hypothetical protein
MLEHHQFVEGETWIVFPLSDTPIRTQRDGDYYLIGLMDAATGLIIGNTFQSVNDSELSANSVQDILDRGLRNTGSSATTLILPAGQFGTVFCSEAERRGTTIVSVPFEQLLRVIGHARESFKEFQGH